MWPKWGAAEPEKRRTGEPETRGQGDGFESRPGPESREPGGAGCRTVPGRQNLRVLQGGVPESRAHSVAWCFQGHQKIGRGGANPLELLDADRAIPQPGPGSLGNKFCLSVPSPSAATVLAENAPAGRRPHAVRLPRRSQRGHWADVLCPEASVRARFPLRVGAGVLPCVLGPR